MRAVRRGSVGGGRPVAVLSDASTKFSSKQHAKFPKLFLSLIQLAEPSPYSCRHVVRQFTRAFQSNSRGVTRRGGLSCTRWWSRDLASRRSRDGPWAGTLGGAGVPQTPDTEHGAFQRHSYRSRVHARRALGRAVSKGEEPWLHVERHLPPTPTPTTNLLQTR